MSTRRIVAVLLLALPATLAAQGQPSPPQRGGGFQRGATNPFQVALGKSADLKLTEEQTAKLRELDKALREKNEPIMAEIRKLRGSGTSMRDIPEADRAKLRELMQTIRKNAAEGTESLKDVLTDEQVQQVQKILQEASAPRPRGN
jgi:Spy/CpxP family protein refolding chaperone